MNGYSRCRLVACWLTAHTGTALAQPIAADAAAQVLDPASPAIAPDPLDPQPLEETDPRRRAALASLVVRLGSPSFEEREQAAKELQHLWRHALPFLVDHYRATDDLEVRQRIDRLLYEAYIDHAVWDRFGFLGISHFVVTFTDRPGGPVRYAARVNSVVAGTAASAAGLRQDDLIIAFHGQPLPPMTDPMAFGDLIRRNPPGTVVPITIVRRNELSVLHATLGRVPRDQVLNPNQPVNPMLEEARRGFARWWTRNFDAPMDSPSAVSVGEQQPSPLE